MDTIGLVIFFAIFFVLAIAPYALIANKAGYSPFWGLLSLIPFVNFIAIIVFAVVEWPLERERDSLRTLQKSRRDEEVELEWGIKMVLKKAITLEKNGKHEEAILQFEQFIEKTDNEQNANLAREHIARIRDEHPGSMGG